jgi:hypothetical protein
LGATGWCPAAMCSNRVPRGFIGTVALNFHPLSGNSVNNLQLHISKQDQGFKASVVLLYAISGFCSMQSRMQDNSNPILSRKAVHNKLCTETLIEYTGV